MTLLSGRDDTLSRAVEDVERTLRETAEGWRVDQALYASPAVRKVISDACDAMERNARLLAKALAREDCA